MKTANILCTVFLWMCLPIAARAEVLDTLSYYTHDSKFVYYRDPGIAMQAARFMPAMPGTVKSISVILGGESGTGGATLHIYGHEGGISAPQLQQDLVYPIAIRKTRPGVEKITVNLPDPVFVENDQFFIAIDNLSPGVALLSDRTHKTPTCAAPSNEFYFQFLKLKNHRWRWGAFSYAIEVIMEYPEPVSPGYMADVTVQVGIPDSALANRSIAWADINGDGYLDLLAGGRLYQNVRGGRFDDITDVSGISGQPVANVFADINNDRLVDVVFIGSTDSAGSESWIYTNDGNGVFVRHVLNLPVAVTPTSVSIADVTGDGFLDVFIGSGAQERIAGGLLLINNHDLTFTDRSYWLHLSDSARSGSLGSQWVDYDNDGRIDLFAAGVTRSLLWHNAGDSTFFEELGVGTSALGGDMKMGRGCDWADYDNDGDLDLLLPNSIGVRDAGNMTGSGTRIYANSGFPDYELVAMPSDNGIRYEEKHTGGAWGDINNDGLMDVVITTSCPCRYADIYIQQSGKRFELGTSEYGLHRIAAGNDATWVDYDNDGQLDMVTIDRGRFRLFRNNGGFSHGNNYVEFDLVPPSGSAGGVGASVTVFASPVRYTQQVSAGRGILMAKPLRLHFGLGDALLVDSVVVRWPNSNRDEVFRQLTANMLHRLGTSPVGGSANSEAVALEAAPNPFSTSLTITYTLSAERNVRIAIYSTDGRYVTTLINEKQHAGSYSVTWDARDRNGERVADGAYIYRLISGDADLMGRAILVR